MLNESQALFIYSPSKNIFEGTLTFIPGSMLLFPTNYMNIPMSQSDETTSISCGTNVLSSEPSMFCSLCHFQFTFGVTQGVREAGYYTHIR